MKSFDAVTWFYMWLYMLSRGTKCYNVVVRIARKWNYFIRGGDFLKHGHSILMIKLKASRIRKFTVTLDTEGTSKNINTFVKTIYITVDSTIVTVDSTLVQSSIRRLWNRRFDVYTIVDSTLSTIESTFLQPSNRRLSNHRLDAYTIVDSTLTQPPNFDIQTILTVNTFLV